jgi:predicted ATP-grasp superfamily ATP-dependent carboligase
MRTLLVCGASTRAAAEGAARAGFSVTSIDAFADRDHHPSVRALSVARDLNVPPTASAVARAARMIGRDAVVYLSPFENHPRAVATLAADGLLLGNPPETLRRVRNPFLLAEALRRHGFAAPSLLNDPNDGNDPNDPNDPNDSNDSWLLKPLRSGGGNRIRTWSRGESAGHGGYVQERIDGTPGSIVFVAANGSCVPIAFSRQIVGDDNFGGAGFRYCGSILAPLHDSQFARGDAVFDAARAVAGCVSTTFGLVGLNGIDFTVRDGIVYPLEVNPRWCSSIEVAERAFGTAVFPFHVAACTRAALPAFDCREALMRSRAVGKAIVYARHAVSVGDTSNWLTDSSVRDIPHCGERFRAGQPVCSVFAAAADSAECYRLLVARAARIHAELQRIAPATTSG